jgi:NAD(P)-dependent dehydrogenase (short-subunit alcohol dehydrogenase family)
MKENQSVPRQLPEKLAGAVSFFTGFTDTAVLVSVGQVAKGICFIYSAPGWHKGSAYCAMEAIQWMKEQGGGDIVNIATSAIYAPRGGTIPYSAAKAAVVNMSRALAWEFGPCGIRVNVVAPGPTETDMVKMFFTPDRLAKTIQEVPLRKICQPEDIAGAVCFLLTSDAAMITGQTLVVDGGRSLRHLES